MNAFSDQIVSRALAGDTVLTLLAVLPAGPLAFPRFD